MESKELNQTLDYLKTTNWSFTDDGWQEDSNDSVKASGFEREAFEGVLEYFTQKRFENNFIIIALKELKDIDYEIELEENTDSFGNVLHLYYDGDSEVQKFLSGETAYDNNEIYKKIDKANNQLKKAIEDKLNALNVGGEKDE